ncbi:MAG: sulfite reductase subunit A [Candidatus Methanomethylicota archaeon]|nr:MAG: sulfite reductase subunit A [Candidatus Verstraetearchaeota archaeon]
MHTRGLPLKKLGLVIGDWRDLERLFKYLKDSGYRIIGPKVDGNVIKLKELKSLREFPKQISDHQAPGYYRLEEGDFFRNGDDSPKKYLFPPKMEIFKVNRDLSISFREIEKVKIAFFGIKSCDTASITIMDKVLGERGDSFYKHFRKELFIVTENCIKPGENCFCSSMGTGPRVQSGFDISFTRIDGKILFEAGSERGVKILEKLKLPHANAKLKKKFIEVLEKAAEKAKANFEKRFLAEKLELAIESPIWKELAEKCLGCGNCTMVCPTCFCFDIYDEVFLDEYSKRVRYWDSCFTYKHAEVAGGHFRPELWARYRQWLLHKFSYWKRQFDMLGCVGCGRCITWCPVGIDIRKAVEKVLKWVDENVR